MTLKDLNQLYYLRREIETLQRIRDDRTARATTVTQTLTGMPRAPGETDKVGDGAAYIADVDAKIGRLLWQCEIETERIVDFIDSCPDSHIRTIMELRFLRFFSWAKVAYILGGGNTDDSVKKLCYRYIKKANKKKSCPECPDNMC